MCKYYSAVSEIRKLPVIPRYRLKTVFESEIIFVLVFFLLFFLKHPTGHGKFAFYRLANIDYANLTKALNA